MSSPRRVAAIAALTALAAVPVAAAATQLRPGISATVVAVLAAVAGVEAVAAAARARELEPGSAGWLRFRAAELLGLALLARAGTLAVLPVGTLRATVVGWWRSPGQVVDAQTAVVFLVLVAVWVLAGATASDLDRAGRVARVTAEVDPLERVTRRYLLVTVIVVAALAVHLRDPTVPLVGVPLLAALAFVVLGLVGVAAVRRVRLEARWERDSVPVAADVAGAWRAHVGALIAGAALVAVVLPTRTGFAGGLLVGVVTVVGRFLGSLTRRFADIDEEGEAVPPGDPEEAMPLPEFLDSVEDPDSPPLTAPEVPAWIEATWPFVFWGALGLLCAFLLVGYVRARPSLARTLRELRVWGALVALVEVAASWWRWLVAALGRRRAAARSAAGRRRAPPGARRPRDRRRPWARRGGRSQVVRAYLGVLAEAERRRVGRRPSQTPYEYEESLAPRLSDAHVELDRLTDLFVEARFGARAPDDRSVELALRDAERVGAALRELDHADRPRLDDLDRDHPGSAPSGSSPSAPPPSS